MKNQIVSIMGIAIIIWHFVANDQSNYLPKFREASLSRKLFLLTNNPEFGLGTLNLDDRD